MPFVAFSGKGLFFELPAASFSADSVWQLQHHVLLIYFSTYTFLLFPQRASMTCTAKFKYKNVFIATINPREIQRSVQIKTVGNMRSKRIMLPAGRRFPNAAPPKITISPRKNNLIDSPRHIYRPRGGSNKLNIVPGRLCAPIRARNNLKI